MTVLALQHPANSDPRYLAAVAIVNAMEPGSERKAIAESLLNCIEQTYQVRIEDFDGGNGMSLEARSDYRA